jgi:dihydroorotate dehydrogenase
MSLLYRLLQPLLFRQDAERAHYLTMNSLQALADVPPIRALIRSLYRGSDEGLAREVFGLRFNNPVGLAAGFDKDARYIRELALLGFGFIEIGTLTPRPQEGNPKPRLFRLPEDRALINRLGFNNQGVEAAARRLEKTDRGQGLIIGGNIGKNKDTPNEQATADYLLCLNRLQALVDYFVVNVSSPNTPGLRELQDKEPLRRLLLTLQEANRKSASPRPLLLKIAPDLTEAQLDDIIDISREADLAGLVATNTTIERSPLRTPADSWQAIGAGGLSGAPLRERSETVLRYLNNGTQGQLPLLGVGGIDSPESAAARLQAGASLVQIYSGMVYAGPDLVSGIKKHLRALI